MSAAEDELALQLRLAGIEHEREFRFHPTRRWRADFRIGDVLVEVEGGTWTAGRHVRPAGFRADCAKYNEATLLGFKVLRVTPDHVRNGYALDVIARAVSA